MPVEWVCVFARAQMHWSTGYAAKSFVNYFTLTKLPKHNKWLKQYVGRIGYGNVNLISAITHTRDVTSVYSHLTFYINGIAEENLDKHRNGVNHL